MMFLKIVFVGMISFIISLVIVSAVGSAFFITFLRLLKLIFRFSFLNNEIFDFPARRSALIGYSLCALLVLGAVIYFKVLDLIQYFQ